MLVVLLLHVGAVLIVVVTEWGDRFITGKQKLKLCEADERRLVKALTVKKVLKKSA